MECFYGWRRLQKEADGQQAGEYSKPHIAR
jgi:hypothetical protein